MKKAYWLRLFCKFSLPLTFFASATFLYSVMSWLLYCFLPHNIYGHLLLSPMCMPRLFICTYLNSSPIACPPSSVLCRWLLYTRFNVCAPLPSIAFCFLCLSFLCELFCVQFYCPFCLQLPLRSWFWQFWQTQHTSWLWRSHFSVMIIEHLFAVFETATKKVVIGCVSVTRVPGSFNSAEHCCMRVKAPILFFCFDTLDV